MASVIHTSPSPYSILYLREIISRFVVEHAISKVKKFDVMGTRFRNRLKHYNHASDIVSGLVNFRIM